jgi:leader peptidase (prepilin peptidase)/N-methyltransferase
VVELLNGVAYLWVYFIFGYTIETIIYCLFTSALITLSFIDWQHKIIPNTINLWIGLLGILHVMLNLEGWTNYLIGFFLVSGILLIIAILSRGQMGMGDVKLMAVSGLILGWQYILLALALGSIVGAFISIALMILKKGGKIVPFGPYLSIGIFISLLYGELIIHWYLTCFLLS